MVASSCPLEPWGAGVNDDDGTERYYTPIKLFGLFTRYGELAQANLGMRYTDRDSGKRKGEPSGTFEDDSTIRADLDRALSALPWFAAEVIRRTLIERQSDERAAAGLGCDPETVFRRRLSGLREAAVALGCTPRDTPRRTPRDRRGDVLGGYRHARHGRIRTLILEAGS